MAKITDLISRYSGCKLQVVILILMPNAYKTAACFIAQTIMTVRSGGSVTSCVKTVLGHTAAAALMATSWSRVMCAKPMCQVQRVTGAFALYMYVVTNCISLLGSAVSVFQPDCLSSFSPTGVRS